MEECAGISVRLLGSELEESVHRTSPRSRADLLAVILHLKAEEVELAGTHRAIVQRQWPLGAVRAEPSRGPAPHILSSRLELLQPDPKNFKENAPNLRPPPVDTTAAIFSSFLVTSEQAVII